MFPRRITAKPNECLITVRNRSLRSLGAGASAVVWPGDSFAVVPTNAQEATFAMQQESADGISLRFKGIVIYRIVQPELACTLFDFSLPLGLDSVSQAISDLCLGELRHVASSLPMERCIRERRTTLTGAVRDAIIPVVEGRGEGDGWGIRLDVVQVAQVYILDKEVFERSQEETKDRFRRLDELSKLTTARELELARMQCEREKAESAFSLEKEEYERKHQSQARWAAFEEEKLAAQARLQQREREQRIEAAHREAQARKDIERLEKEKALEIEGLEVEGRKEIERAEKEKALAIDGLEVEGRLEIAGRELELRRMRSEIAAIDTKDTIERERALMEIRREILPIEQLPHVAEALSGIFRNANLSLYGAENPILATVGSLLDMVMSKVGRALSSKE